MAFILLDEKLDEDPPPVVDAYGTLAIEKLEKGGECIPGLVGRMHAFEERTLCLVDDILHGMMKFGPWLVDDIRMRRKRGLVRRVHWYSRGHDAPHFAIVRGVNDGDIGPEGDIASTVPERRRIDVSFE